MRIAVIQNLPKAPEEKYEKLMGVVRTIASKLGDVRESESGSMRKY